MDPIISFLTIKYRTQFISILQIFIGLLLEINMSNRQFTTLQRITIEALDCVIKTNNYDSHGHLNISIEPRIPVESPNRIADPLLSQTTGQQKDTLSATAVSSANPTSELPALTDTITSQTDTTLPTLEDTMTSPTITSPYSLSEDTDIAQYLSTSGDYIETVTPVPDNKVPENNDTPSEPSTSQLQQNTKQTQTFEDNSDFDMSDYVKTHRFQEKLKSSKEFSDTIAKHPGHIRNLMLQILSTYPDILDDKSGPILEYIKTDVGNIPIIQPSYDTFSEPDTTQSEPVHQDDDIHQMECQNPIDSTNTLHLNTNENDRATIVPRSPPPEASDSDSEDCIIQEVIPPPEKIDQADTPPLEAPPPEIPSSETPPPGLPKTKAQLKLFPDGTVPQILLQLPYGTQDRFYTLTTINKTQTMKRHRPRDNSPEPSTSTGTYTKSGHSKSKKQKKKNRKDKS